MNIHEALKRFQQVRLFTKVGSTIDDVKVTRIWSWSEWRGPEEPLVEQMAVRQQAMFDGLFPDGETEDWKELLDGMVKTAIPSAPYDHSKDSWYAPNAAVWFAAWTFALEAVYFDLQVDLPSALLAQRYWFELGHWPCSLKELEGGADVYDYIIY